MKTVTVPEAARLAGVHRGEAYRRVHSGDWPSLRVNKMLRVPLAAVLNDETPTNRLAGASTTQRKGYSNDQFSSR